MKDNQIHHLNANAIYKEMLTQKLNELKEQKSKIEQGMQNIEDDLKRLDEKARN